MSYIWHIFPSGTEKFLHSSAVRLANSSLKCGLAHLRKKSLIALVCSLTRSINIKAWHTSAILDMRWTSCTSSGSSARRSWIRRWGSTALGSGRIRPQSRPAANPHCHTCRCPTWHPPPQLSHSSCHHHYLPFYHHLKYIKSVNEVWSNHTVELDRPLKAFTFLAISTTVP